MSIKTVVVGGGWAGTAAALSARKAGADVILLEKTDLLLGLGNVGGIFRNNGRFTAAEENIAMGASELFDIMDRLARHRNIDFPGHRHASFYDVVKAEPAARRLLKEAGVEIKLASRITDAEYTEKTYGDTVIKHVDSVITAENERIEGDVFVECTGSSGPMGNCVKYGKGCAMCIQRCAAFGPRVSITEKIGLHDIRGKRADGIFGAVSGSCKIEKNSLSEELSAKLDEKGVAVIPLEREMIKPDKLKMKVCRQYALNEYAENIILIDTGYAKLMTPFFPLDELRRIRGFENARYADPYAGGKGNSVRYMSVAERENSMLVCGTDNLFCAGEKSGLFVGHTEAVTTGSLAGHNACRAAAGKELVIISEKLAAGDIIAYERLRNKTEDGIRTRYTFAGDEYFERMKSEGLYSVDINDIEKRVKECALHGIYNKKVI